MAGQGGARRPPQCGQVNKVKVELPEEKKVEEILSTEVEKALRERQRQEAEREELTWCACRVHAWGGGGAWAAVGRQWGPGKIGILSFGHAEALGSQVTWSLRRGSGHRPQMQDFCCRPHRIVLFFIAFFF